MEELGRNLKQDADRIGREVIGEWDRLGTAEPWHRLPKNIDLDHLPDMIRALAEAALLSFFGEDERYGLAVACVRHGDHRYSTGHSEEVLAREYGLLRAALWQRVRSLATDSTAAAHAIIRLDSALTFAHGASLRGYHRDHIEQTADFETVLDAYVEQWEFGV